MVSDDEAEVWELISDRARSRGGRATVADACAACADALGVDGLGLSLLAGDRLEPTEAVGVLGYPLLEAELTSGDGPCMEAMTLGGPVLVTDLAEPVSGRRWPLFVMLAQELKVRAVFAFPLITGVIRVGVLVLCRTRSGGLSAAEHGRTLIFADAMLSLLLHDQAGVGPEAALSADALALGPEIHQASGMVSVQLDTDVHTALLRLRAHAFAHDESLSEVARQVVSGVLRLSPDGDPP